MTDDSLTDLQRLKEAVRLKAEERLGVRKPFSDWSLNDIQDFRVDLEEECRSSVSEKWFYTHLKNDHDKLPRIDVLNLLSQYCGYKNWDDFSFQHKAKPSKSVPLWFWITTIGTAIGTSLVLSFWPAESPLIIHAIDAYTQDEIDPSTLTTRKLTGENIAKIKRKNDSIWVDGAYYKPKKVYLGIEEDTLRVKLYPDDYAMMLNFFSRSSTDDWERRREQLEEAIHPDAKIFQNHPQYSGIEMLNKEEFIYRLTLPINSLQNLEIQDIVYQDEKIYRLRFVQKDESDE